jgi:hypothetical protein
MSDPLPDLPLMLADIPAPVTNLLRAIGLPVELLPRMALLAHGVGRFVLFDSRNPRSVAQAARARKQGLKPIDLAEFPQPAEETDIAPGTRADFRLAEERAARNRLFLERLKTELELRHGIWVRIADFPFPFQSALCLGVEHSSHEPAGFRDAEAALPGDKTHFVSSRLRPEQLSDIAAPGIESGWCLQPDDVESTVRRTLSHWRTRAARFTAAGVEASGLSVHCQETSLPPLASLSSLGFQYACLPRRLAGCAPAGTGRAARDAGCIVFGVAALPRPDEAPRWLETHYDAGCPLFVSEPASELPLLQQLASLSADEGRFSLLWRTTFARFAAWWQARRAVRLQVWRHDDSCEIHAAGDWGNQRWGIEIRRGNHMATLPLAGLEMRIQDEGLAYVSSARKSFGGCTIPHETVLDLARARSGRNRAA